MHISKNKNNLIISFQYKPQLVSVVQKLEDRKFNNKHKTWSVPIIHVKTVVNKLVPLGFTITSEVKDEYLKYSKKLKKLKRLKSGKFNEAELELLKSLGLPMYGYQNVGAGFMCIAKGALLGDQPGLGKTLQTLAAIELKKLNKILIVCPAILKQTWKDEIEKWLENNSTTIIAGEKSKRTKLWKENTRFHIMNYEQLLKDLKEIKLNEYDAIVADEATKISNPAAKITISLKKLKAEYKFALTGTPLNNTIQDIWSVVDFCAPGLLGSYWQFTEMYCIKNIADYNMIVGYKNLEILKKKLEYVMIRRLKTDVLKELPPKTYENIFITFSTAERKMYQSIQNEIKEELKEMKNKRALKNILTKMLRLKQMTCSSELVFKNDFLSSKTNALHELISSAVSNHIKVIVFTQFKEMAVLLERDFKKYNPLLVTGGMKDSTKNEYRDKFNNDDENKILIMTDAGAFGLNLQKKASIIIHYDLPWSITKAEQREDRVHRIGQNKNVTVYKLMIENSVDEYNLRVLYNKQCTSDSLIDDNKVNRKTTITKKDINNLLSINV